jgi:type I restriction enzyme S subunit
MELLSVTINDGVMPRSEIEGKDNSSEDKSNYKVVLAGDMVYNSMRMWQGANGISPCDGIVSPSYTVLMPKIPISNGYFAALFKSPNLINEFRKNSQGMTSDTWNLKYPQIETIKVSIPVLSEQERIANMLGTLDQRIAKQAKLVNSLKKYKRGLISEILKQKLVITHKDETWEEVSLSDVADGFEYGMNAAATSFDGEHKYIRITDIDDDSHTYIDCNPVSPSGVLEEKYRVVENDILFARTGASVGKSYIYRKADGDLFFAGFLIRIHVKEDIDSGYVFLNTLTEDYDKWVLLESARSGQPGINAEQYRRYRFKLPPLKTQKQISAIAQKMDEQIKMGNQCLRLLQKQRDGLLQQLFI